MIPVPKTGKLNDNDPCPIYPHKGKSMRLVPAWWLYKYQDIPGADPRVIEYVERNQKVIDLELEGR